MAGQTITRRLNPQKLLLSKWTATQPINKEKHFIVTRLIEPDPPDGPVELIEIEAVHSNRSVQLRWRELTDCEKWLQGWR
jgi:tryptophan-rich hypothetical protein